MEFIFRQRGMPDYEGLARRRAVEFESAQRTRGLENVRFNLIASLREGIRSSWSASPDLFPASFDLDATAAACADFIGRHQ